MKHKPLAGKPAAAAPPAAEETAASPPEILVIRTAGPVLPPALPHQPTEREAIEAWENEGDPN